MHVAGGFVDEFAALDLYVAQARMQRPLVRPAHDVLGEQGPFLVAAALEGARAILVERFAEDADLIGRLREEMWSNGVMASTVRKGKKTEGEKFKDYFDFSEPFTKLPSHRILALLKITKLDTVFKIFDSRESAMTVSAASNVAAPALRRTVALRKSTNRTRPTRKK